MSDSQIVEKPRKIANIVAAAIERDIIENRMAIGTPLATESELCRRYGASRWAIREAIAIVQNDGLITVRRGRTGGAMVSCTPGQALAAAICGFLLYAQMSNEHILQGRAVLDRLLFERACARPVAVPPDVAELVAAGDRGELHTVSPGDLFDGVLDLAGSTVVSVIASALSKLTLCRLSLLGIGSAPSLRPDINYRLRQLRYTQLRSMVGLDAESSYAVTAETTVIFRRMFAEFSAGRQLANGMAERRDIAAMIAQILRPKQEVKPASVVSTMLMLDAIGMNEDATGYLGSEDILVRRYGVPRNMLREGIRILERDGFIRTEQGRAGGIRIGDPDESDIVERATRFFAFSHCPVEDVEALVRDFRMLAIDLLFTQAGTEKWLEDRLRDLAARNIETPIDTLFEAVARRTGNALLLIVEKIGMALLPQDRKLADQQAWLATFTDAVANDSPPLLRRRVAALYGGS